MKIHDLAKTIDDAPHLENLVSLREVVATIIEIADEVESLKGQPWSYTEQTAAPYDPNKDPGVIIDVLHNTIKQLAWFIENVNDDTPDRTDKFFACREAWRNAHELVSKYYEE